jgi:hypothetical protein
MKISKGGKKPPAKVSQEKAEEINGPDGEMTIPYRASLHDHAIVPSQQALRLLCAARLFFSNLFLTLSIVTGPTTKVDPIQVSLCCHLFKTSFLPFSKAWKSKLWRRVFSPLSHSLSPVYMIEPLLCWFVGSSASAIRTFAAVASVYRTIHYIDRFICMRCTIGQHRVDNTHRNRACLDLRTPFSG